MEFFTKLLEHSPDIIKTVTDLYGLTALMVLALAALAFLLLKSAAQIYRLVALSITAASFLALVGLTLSRAPSLRPEPAMTPPITSLAFDQLYDRIRDVQGAVPDGAQCAADPRGSVVQIFQNGWLVYRHSGKIYAVWPEHDGDPIRGATRTTNTQWREYDDVATLPDTRYITPCEDIPNDAADHLTWGFRRLYCDPKSTGLRASLGAPLSDEMTTWTQFQQTTRGMLIAGIPSYEQEKGTGRFFAMSIVFLEKAGRDDNSGRGQTFATNSGSVLDAGCMALWRPASPSRSVYPDPDAPLHTDKSCKRALDPRDYVRGGKGCLVFG